MPTEASTVTIGAGAGVGSTACEAVAKPMLRTVATANVAAVMLVRIPTFFIIFPPFVLFVCVIQF